MDSITFPEAEVNESTAEQLLAVINEAGGPAMKTYRISYRRDAGTFDVIPHPPKPEGDYVPADIARKLLEALEQAPEPMRTGPYAEWWNYFAKPAIAAAREGKQ